MFLSCKETVIILFFLHIFFLTWQCVCFFLVVCDPDCDWLGFFSDSAIDQGSDGRQCLCGEVRHWEVSVPVLLEVQI